MPLPSLIQTVPASGFNTSTGNPDVATISFTGVVSGNTLVVTIHQSAAATRTYTVSSDVDGNFTQGAFAGDDVHRAGVWYLFNATSGSHTITCTSSGNTEFDTLGQEWQDADELDNSDHYNNAVDATSHTASSGGINIAADSVIFVAATANANPGSFGQTDWTEIADNGAGTPYAMAMYKTTGSTITGENGDYTTASSRETHAAILSLKATAAAGGFTSGLTLLGAG